jgi:hypothetical protein
MGPVAVVAASALGSLVAHEPPGSLVSGDGVDNPDRTATARRHGQRPSISTSNEKLRNVLILSVWTITRPLCLSVGSRSGAGAAASQPDDRGRAGLISPLLIAAAVSVTSWTRSRSRMSSMRRTIGSVR